MTKDPVCGMQVDERQAAATAEYQGVTYYFCSSSCHKTFTADPRRYAARGGESQHQPGHGTTRKS